ncbi:D-2-hydroxyacid dehydrogenase [Nakamurella flavida]|uniref:D-2-hydroxyacid dehydrogenase n=1 Tax=Nakamurella flavida TaxID=363630 RepID=A0A939C2U7_9ACTN|nr:D-2-hydroxyacid dehydrogenase [Nakamurella flavida]MBM9476401.1 D-2-hydroxyacid dehydrogenase [Nakamurella flavida]MDP9779498.1 phosphoglycerate dehydrogenase-like enzyme [Nakamurella flavida]
MTTTTTATAAGAPTDGTPRTISRVLATVPYRPDELDQLRAAFAPATLIHCASTDTEAIAEALETVDVAVLEGDLDDRFVVAPHLRWVHCDHAGLNKSARPDVFARGLLVTGSAGRSAPALAQHGFYFALSLTYEAQRMFQMQAQHVWRGIPGYVDKVGLWGKTLGVVGLGHTGREMAALGRAFGMRVIAYRRSTTPVPENVDVLLCADRDDSIDPLVEEADVIMLATPLTDDTFHLFAAPQFERMKSTALIVNMARGPVIDEDALLVALQTGQIGGAGLDVFATEPLPADSPLWDAPNIVLTPHATPRMPDKTQRSIDTIVENARRYRAGLPMLNAISEKDVFTHTAVTTAR